MNPRRLATFLMAVTLVGAGAYLLLYLYRWEWNRALTAGLFVLIAEVALVGLGVTGRIRKLEDRLAPPSGTARALQRIQATPSPARNHFAWLAPQDRFGVFVPVLMGAGVILSGLAWLVEKLAKATATPAMERSLVRKLDPMLLDAEIATHGLVTAPVTVASVPDILLAPRSRS